MIGINVTVTLERTLYLDLPDDTIEEDIIKEAKKEIINPVEVLHKTYDLLRKVNINVRKLDSKDWSICDFKYKILR